MPVAASHIKLVARRETMTTVSVYLDRTNMSKTIALQARFTGLGPLFDALLGSSYVLENKATNRRRSNIPRHGLLMFH